MNAATVQSLFDLDYRLVPTEEPPAEDIRLYYCTRSPDERANFTYKRVRIYTAELDQSVQCTDALLQRARNIDLPGGLLILGDGGSGKTFISDHILRRYPAKHTRTQSFVPIIRVDIEEKARPELLQTGILTALGALGATQLPKDGRKKDDVESALSDCGTCGIILNESQRMMLASGRRNAERAAGPMGDYLMELYDRTRIAFIFLAKPGLAELWLQDAQLETRWSGRIDLSYYRDDLVWQGLVAAIDEALPMQERAGLDTPELRAALYKISIGRFRTLKYFLSEAVRLAATEGLLRLTADVFSRTFYSLALPGENPFLGLK